VVTFDSAFVQGDTLIGKVDGGWQRLPLANGQTLRAREPSQSRTLALVALTAGASAAASWYLLERDGTVAHPCFASCMLLPDGSVASCYCC